VLQPLLRKHPDVADVWFYLALAVGSEGRDAEALAYLDAALRIDPRGVNLHVARAGTLIDLGRREEALAECHRALALDPGNRQATALMAGLSRLVRK
jgi:tetratricopeptide (TPR) repeat protein